MSNIKELREYDYLVDTDTELEHGPVHDNEEVLTTINENLTTVIAEDKQDKKVKCEKLILMMLLRHNYNLKTVLLLIQKRALLMNL